MQSSNILDKVKRIHFVGIGGSGMCPMAEILHGTGYTLTGSDRSMSETLERIKGYGIPVHMGHAAENIGDAELVVYTAAVKQDNPELVAARERGIPTMERSVMLGELTRRYNNAIAISGTHGKTTTTAMTTQVLLESGMDPSAVIGGKLPLIHGNGRVGHSETMVCEACEYVDSFLQLTPDIGVILNVDSDHLDYFKNLENIIRSFRQFASQTTTVIVVNGDDANAMQAVAGLQNARIVTFGLGEENEYRAVDITTGTNHCRQFAIAKSGAELCRVCLQVPGRHNVYNALAAAVAADLTGAEGEKIGQALSRFSGVHRRFEIRGHFGGITVADDFAHHPTELQATLTAATELGYNEVWAIFQPHTYSRTYLLFDDFVRVLSIPHHLLLTDILAVREENVYGITSQMLADRIPGAKCFPDIEQIAQYAMQHAKPGDLILTIGGGDIYRCADLLVKKYGNL